ncbi:MAG: ceramidase domain-containing protein [Holophagaceae bacterium]|nr:ceramidase domain-containing protein [Holophagaceae bacterium]
MIFTAGVIVLALLLPRIAQPAAYHAFADQRTMLGIPNFWNVVSNAAFIPVGLAALWVMVRNPKPRFHAPFERWAYFVAFAGVLLVGLGSGYYHLHPDNRKLFWDRLPMTLVFMALMSAVIAERIHAKVGGVLLLPFLLLGILSAEVWRRGELTGIGDLRFYLLVQFYPMLAIPMMMALFPASYTRTRDMAWLVLWYAIAKALEQWDGAVFRATGGSMSGHALKHVAAALAVAALVAMVARREPLVSD